MILLQAAGGSGLTSLLFMGGMLVVFYFFMMRPQMKKQKEQQKMLEELKEGDEIVTMGGLHGKIVAKDETTFTISAGGGARLTFEKSAIARKK